MRICRACAYVELQVCMGGMPLWERWISERLRSTATGIEQRANAVTVAQNTPAEGRSLAAASWRTETRSWVPAPRGIAARVPSAFHYARPDMDDANDVCHRPYQLLPYWSSPSARVLDRCLCRAAVRVTHEVTASTSLLAAAAPTPRPIIHLPLAGHGSPVADCDVCNVHRLKCKRGGPAARVS